MSNNTTMVRNAVNGVIEQLTQKGSGKRTGRFTAWGTAMLAKLRRAAGTPPGESADIWEVTIGAVPDGLADENRNLEKAELAIHIALTLFGVHQQGIYESVHKEGDGFGKAVKSLIDPDLSNEAGIRRRFNALATASEFTELSYHARGLVQLMRTKNVGFDYAGFATELFRYQFSPEQRDRVRIKWGRDFYSQDKTDQNIDGEGQYHE
jgi:CRISPR system Cascade subunit CasB